MVGTSNLGFWNGHWIKPTSVYLFGYTQWWMPVASTQSRVKGIGEVRSWPQTGRKTKHVWSHQSENAQDQQASTNIDPSQLLVLKARCCWWNRSSSLVVFSFCSHIATTNSFLLVPLTAFSLLCQFLVILCQTFATPYANVERVIVAV